MGLPAIESSRTEELYREHGAAVARFCRSLLRDHAEAEDATQQVFLSAHRALLNGSAPREPLAWLLAVARHECYARFRQRQTSPAPADDVPDSMTPDASVHVLRAGEIETVWEEVERMPRAQRDAFLLREIRGLSYSQLAAELSLSGPSVRSLLVRARTRLRHRLRDVAASLGGAPWIQALVRLAGGGDGASPVPAATKAAAVGIGALALVGGGDLARTPHHASRTAGQAALHHHRAQARVRHAATPAAAAVAPSEDRHSRDGRSGGGGSRESGSGSQEAREGSDGFRTSGDGSSGSGHDGSDDTTAVAPTTTSGSDGSGSGSSSTSSGSGRDSSGHGSSDGSSSGSTSGSGSDDGSGTTTTTTTTTSSGSDGHGSGGTDGGSSGGSDGGGGSSGPGG